MDGQININNRFDSKKFIKSIIRRLNQNINNLFAQIRNIATRQSIEWHGTSAKCNDGRCMLPTCTLCQIVNNGFNKDCARKDTYSYGCWGEATYFAT